MLKFVKKAISAIAAVSMMLSILPYAAFAEETQTPVSAAGTVKLEAKDGQTGNDAFNTIMNITLTQESSALGGKAQDDKYIKAVKKDVGGSTPRFSLYNKTGAGYFKPNEATKTMLWSMDVYYPDTTKFTNITLATDGGEAMAQEVTSSMISAGVWHNLSVIYQPGTNGTDKLGTASLFVDGKYISSKSLGALSKSDRGKEYRTIINFDKDNPIYFDNIILAETDGFAAPCFSTNSFNVSGYEIIGYSTMTAVSAKNVLNTALGSGYSVVIKDKNDGTVEDSTNVAGGMKAVAAVKVTVTDTESNSSRNIGAESYNVEYTFGVLYKILASLTGENTTSIADRNGCIVSVEKNSLGGKVNTDSYLKFSTATANDSLARFAVNDSSGTKIACNAGKIVLYSVDMFVPTESLDKLEYIRFMRSGGASNSEKLPVSDLTAGTWNKILYVLYNDGEQYYGDIYVNGVLKKAKYMDGKKALTGDLRFCVCFKEDGKVFYLDNINIAVVDSFARPEITTDEYVARLKAGTDGTIDGYKGKKVSEIKSAANGLTGDVCTAVGAAVKDEDLAEKGMYFMATKDYSDAATYGVYAGKYSYKYVLGEEDHSFGAYTVTVGGTKITDNKYSGIGELKITAPVYNYMSEDFKGIAFLAKFNSAGKLVSIEKTQEFSVGAKQYDGNNKIELSVNIADTNHTFKAFIWNSFSGMKPLGGEVLTISPAGSGNAE